jgi:energy-coupling factor transporter ATP-binding protein EcfA2
MEFEKQHALKVLSFWLQTEFFNTLDLKSLLPGADDGVLQFTTEELLSDPSCLPWFNRERIRAAGDKYYPNQQFAYTLYLGIFNRSEFFEQSQDYFNNEPNIEVSEDWQQRRQDDGITCCAKMKLNAEAVLQLDSLEMSTAPWALGKLLEGKVDQLNKDDFDADVDKFKDRLQQINALASNIKIENNISSAYTTYELFELLKLLSSWAGFVPTQTRFAVIIQLNRQHNDSSIPLELMLPENVTSSFKQLPSLVKNTPVVINEAINVIKVETEGQKTIVPASKNEPALNMSSLEEQTNDIPILNSFFVNDIALAINALKNETLLPQSPLTHFLFEKVSHNEDLLTHEGERLIASKLLIKNTPLGRWPDSEHHTMSLMQQFSINAVEQHIKTGGIYSVNGPPGTGKTTMLRDIIAANIVKRAKVLSGLKEAKNAFLTEKKIKIGDEIVKIKPLIPQLCGYEMVVVSSNNTAVENITKELPQTKALGDKFIELSYLKTVAQKIAANVIDKDKSKTMFALAEQDDCWGFIAAALGNSGNRKRFNGKVFFDKAINMICDDVSSGYQTLVECIKTLSEEGDVKLAFSNAQNEFIKAERNVEKAINDIHRLECLGALKKELASLQIEVLTKEAIYRKSLKVLVMLKQRCLPWWHYRVFKGCQQRSVITALARRVVRKESDFLAKESEYSLFKAKVEQEIQTCALISEVHDDVIFYDEDTDLDSSSIQRKAFGHSKQLNLLRSQLSASAFELQQAWLLASYKTGFSSTVNQLNNLLQDKIESADDAKLMWQCFFMVCPVVSSAFASVSNQFSKLGQGDIGWLFIDESGQATPPQAVGALYRAKRAVVVGDPLQIEPVCTTPPEIIENLGRRLLHDNWDIWSPSITSVQELADRVNPFGTQKIALEKWLGSPLRVHRRCSDPMFSIANQIAYNNKMLHGLDSISEEDDFIWGPSAWFDIKGTEQTKHYVPEQASYVLGMLTLYINEHGMLPDCYIISPFSKVKQGLTHYLKDNFSHEEVSTNDFNSWLNGRVGTVHTFQGKEEKLVIFVLGASDSAGAANWAASKPNLLNVALTRAKKRVYLIGCYDMWSSLSYFSDAFSLLDQKALIADSINVENIHAENMV